MYIIQKVYLQHGHLYASLDSIPAHSLDGKDNPTAYYIIVSEAITELPAHAVIMYGTEDEAREELARMDEDQL